MPTTLPREASFRGPRRMRTAHQQFKEELCLDHFEGRSWTGLRRHALMTMIAFAFLQSRRLKQGKTVCPPVMRIGSARPSNPRTRSVGRATSPTEADIRSYPKSPDLKPRRAGLRQDQTLDAQRTETNDHRHRNVAEAIVEINLAVCLQLYLSALRPALLVSPIVRTLQVVNFHGVGLVVNRVDKLVLLVKGLDQSG